MWNNHGIRRLRVSFLGGGGEAGLFFLHPSLLLQTYLHALFILRAVKRNCSHALPGSWRGIIQGLSINVFFFLCVTNRTMS